MRWIAWGNRIVTLNGATQKQPMELGRFVSAMNAPTAFRDAKQKWGRSLDYIQSEVSYNIQRLEIEASKKNSPWTCQRAKGAR